MDGWRGEWFARIRKSDGRREVGREGREGRVPSCERLGKSVGIRTVSEGWREGRVRRLKGFHFGLMFILLVVRAPGGQTE